MPGAVRSAVSAALGSWRPIASILLVCQLVPIWLAVQPRTYTAVSSFTAQGRRSQSPISGIASQFGLSLSAGEGAQTPGFYSDLAKSRRILGAVVDTKYSIPSQAGVPEGNLVVYLRVGGATHMQQRDRAIRKLSRLTSALPTLRTGVVTLRVTMPDPRLADEVNRRILNLLDRWNRESRQSQAAAERRFTEQRMTEEGQALREAENRLQGFLQRNRDTRNSPQLSFEQERLAREITIRQEVYTTLAQAFQQARIEEVRDTPVLTIIDTSEVPVTPDGRGVVRAALLSTLLGTLIAAALILAKELPRSTNFFGRNFREGARSVRVGDDGEGDTL